MQVDGHHGLRPRQFGSSATCPCSCLVAMVASGRRIPVTKPARVRPGYYFKTCRPYRSAGEILYDYCLFAPSGKKLKLQLRGRRGYLSYNFLLRAGGQERLDVHRLFAMNSPRCNLRMAAWSVGRHVHHHPFPARRPWSNCCERNMLVLSRGEHEAWHRRHPAVPACWCLR